MSEYTEDTLVQQTTAEYLEQQLGWESVYDLNTEATSLAATIKKNFEELGV